MFFNQVMGCERTWHQKMEIWIAYNFWPTVVSTYQLQPMKDPRHVSNYFFVYIQTSNNDMEISYFCERMLMLR